MLLWLTPDVLDLLVHLVNQQLLQLPLDSSAAFSNSGPISMAVSFSTCHQHLRSWRLRGSETWM